MNRHNPDRHIGPVLAELAAIVADRPVSPFAKVGDRRMITGREFVAVAVEPYKARSGESQLVTWRGQCATCGTPFEAKGSRVAAGLPVNCETHRGRRTRRRRTRATQARPSRALLRNAALCDLVNAALEAVRSRQLKSAALQLVNALRILGKGDSHDR